MGRVYVVGTADTKGEEMAYLAGVIRAAGRTVALVDVGTRKPAIPVDIAAEKVAAHHPAGADAVLGIDDRGTAVAGMSAAFAAFAETLDEHNSNVARWRRLEAERVKADEAAKAPAAGEAPAASRTLAATFIAT